MALETTQAANGSDSQALISIDDGATYAPIKELVNGSIQDTENRVAADSHRYRRRSQSVPGRSQSSMTITANWLNQDDDPGMALLRQAKREGLQNVRVKILARTKVGADKLELVGHVSSMSMPLPDATVETIDIGLDINALDDNVTVTQDDLDQLGPLPD